MQGCSTGVKDEKNGYNKGPLTFFVFFSIKGFPFLSHFAMKRKELMKVGRKKEKKERAVLCFHAESEHTPKIRHWFLKV